MQSGLCKPNLKSAGEALPIVHAGQHLCRGSGVIDGDPAAIRMVRQQALKLTVATS